MAEPVAVWRHAFDLAVVTSPGRVALVDLSRPQLPPRVLEGSAAAIWGAVDGSRTVEEVTVQVAQSFGIEPAEISEEVDRFLGDLEVAGLVEAT